MKFQFEHILLIFFLLLVLYYLSRCNCISGIDSIDRFRVGGQDVADLSLPYGGNVQAAMRAHDRGAIRAIFAAHDVPDPPVVELDGAADPQTGCYIINNTHHPKSIYMKLSYIFSSLYSLHTQKNSFENLKKGETFTYKEPKESKESKKSIYTDSFKNVRAKRLQRPDTLDIFQNIILFYGPNPHDLFVHGAIDAPVVTITKYISGPDINKLFLSYTSAAEEDLEWGVEVPIYKEYNYTISSTNVDPPLPDDFYLEYCPP